jgi:hypothetical protein
MYCGIFITWDYIHRTVDISMPGYVKKALQRFCHTPTTRVQNSPHSWTHPYYGANHQMTPRPDEFTKLDAAGITRVQDIIGVFLFYRREVSSTILVALNTIASQQANSTHATARAVTHLLNYDAAHPYATI